jgi:hypothetical protein
MRSSGRKRKQAASRVRSEDIQRMRQGQIYRRMQWNKFLNKMAESLQYFVLASRPDVHNKLGPVSQFAREGKQRRTP